MSVDAVIVTFPLLFPNHSSPVCSVMYIYLMLHKKTVLLVVLAALHVR